MAGLNAWKKRMAKPDISAPPRQLESALKRQLAWASGTEYFGNRDPVYHISESFQQTFAMYGNRHLGNALYSTHMQQTLGLLNGADKAAGGENAYGSEALSESEQEKAQTRFFEKTSMDGVFAPAPGKQDHFLSRFSETAFNRGNLAGAVMRGTGQMMLVSCLKRTIGQSQPKNFRERMLFESGASAKRNVNGYPPDKVIFNKGETDSAIALVVDALRDARRVVDSLTSLLENGLEGGTGAGTLQKLYPFLSTAREQALLERYRGVLLELRGPEFGEKRRVLHRAIERTHELIAKKRQMRLQFIHHLRSLSDQAAYALGEFAQEGFKETVFGALSGAPPPSPRGAKDDADEPVDARENEREEELE